jgi:hypothetical protein
LTDVLFVPPRPSDLTPTSVTASKGRCSLRRDLVRCSIGTLAPRREAVIVVRADGRRVSAYDGGTWLSMPLVGRAREPSLDPSTNLFDARVFLPRCTTRTPGGGSILGSPDAELICGRRGPDRIHASGLDRVLAGAGDDIVFARNNRRDFIRCGAGRDRVVADHKDRATRDCERVRRK